MLGAIPQERWKKEFFKTYKVFSGYEFYNIVLKFYNIFLFITADTTLPLILQIVLVFHCKQDLHFTQ